MPAPPDPGGTFHYSFSPGCETYWGYGFVECGRTFAVTNLDRVHQSWIIHELKFYWDAGCQLELNGDPFQIDPRIYSSGEADYAFDNNLDTSFRSRSAENLGGNKPLSELN
jgi:hypothetical protein